MQIIVLTQGKFAIVDDEDYQELSKYKWYVGSRGYAIRHPKMIKGIRKGHIAMHRIIINAPDGMEVDHRDGNRLNNQKVNLRICTRKQNLHNQKTAKNNKSGYRGISYRNKDQVWVASLACDGKIYSRWCKTKQKAIETWNMLAKKYYGEFAYQHMIR